MRGVADSENLRREEEGREVSIESNGQKQKQERPELMNDVWFYFCCLFLCLCVLTRRRYDDEWGWGEAGRGG
jgi:hypothetical protein